MSPTIARPEHEVAYQDLCKLISKHADKLTALEMLAIAANMVGKLVAMQDQRVVTPTVAMDIIAKNIELGNKLAIDEIMQSKGSA